MVCILYLKVIVDDEFDFLLLLIVLIVSMSRCYLVCCGSGTFVCDLLFCWFLVCLGLCSSVALCYVLLFV